RIQSVRVVFRRTRWQTVVKFWSQPLRAIRKEYVVLQPDFLQIIPEGEALLIGFVYAGVRLSLIGELDAVLPTPSDFSRRAIAEIDPPVTVGLVGHITCFEAIVPNQTCRRRRGRLNSDYRTSRLPFNRG